MLSVSTKAAVLPVNYHYRTDCQGPISFEQIVWSNVLITVNPPYVAGDYSFQRDGYLGYTVRLASDGTYQIVGGSSFGYTEPHWGGYTPVWTLSQRPVGGTGSITGDSEAAAGAVCDGNYRPANVIATVNLVVGPQVTPTPTPGTNTTDGDKKVGGNQCTTKRRRRWLNIAFTRCWLA